MYKNKLGVVAFMDKDEVSCCDEDVVSCLDEGVVAFLDNNIKDGLYRFSPCTAPVIDS